MSQVLQGMLFGVAPIDPLTFSVVPIFLVSAALVACWVPAQRASAIEPSEALRHS